MGTSTGTQARRTSFEECSPRYMLNDAGNADRFVASHGDRMRWIEDRGNLMVFNGKVWRADWLLAETWIEELMKAAYADAGDIDDTNERKTFVRFINQSLQRRGIVDAINSARRKLTRMKVADFDTDDCLLNFENGTVDLRTGILRAHRKDDYLTKMIPYEYDPEAAAPRWLEFLERIVAGRTIGSSSEPLTAARAVEYLQTAVGCSVTGISGKHLFVCHGPKDTGKTTFLETIREVLGPGEYSGVMQIDTLLMRSDGDLTAKADIADLQGLRFVCTSEVDKGRRLAVARVKYLTSGGAIKACYKHGNPFSFHPSHTIWMDTNEKPVISDPHDAIWGRMRLIPFRHQIPKAEQQATFKAELLNERAGIAAWVARGAAKYLRAGLTEPPEILETTEEYRVESDRLGDFLEEQCEIDPKAPGWWVASTDLWNCYTAWAASAGESPLKRSDFDSQVEKRGCSRRHDPSATKRAWRGLRLRQPTAGPDT